MRERFNLPNDDTGIDGIYEERGGNQVAYQVKYRKNHNLTFAEVSPFLGITEKFTDRVIFTNASSLSDKAADRTRWYSGEVFNALTQPQFGQIEAWLKEKPAPMVRAIPGRCSGPRTGRRHPATAAAPPRPPLVVALLAIAPEPKSEKVAENYAVLRALIPA
jgi:hypothetical protein